MGIIQKDKIKMKWNGANRKNFEARGYVFTHAGDEFEIIVDDLHDRSHVPVLCQCDFCGKEFTRPYFKVVNQDKIACLACKGKLTAYNLEKEYGKGINNVAKVPSIKKKIEQTNLEKYGAVNVWGSKQIQEKIKQTNLERYGVPNPQQNKEIRDRSEQTNLERYGAKNPFGSKIIQEKIKETNMEKRGVPYACMDLEVKERIAQTNLERYGGTVPVASKEVVKKIQQTNLERYGVPCSFQSEQVKEKAQKTRRERGHVMASNQQIHYANLFNAKWEYLLFSHLRDIVFEDKMICVECDFGGHFIYGLKNHKTELNLLFSDMKRDEQLLLNNWKVIHYIQRRNNFPTDCDMFLLNLRLMKILQTTNINRILVDVNYRIIRFEPSFVVKSLDLFL